MKFKAPLFLLAAVLGAQFLNAQQPAMSATTGLAAGNSFTLFVTFEDSMPKVDTIACYFSLVGNAKPGQEDFAKAFNCVGPPKKIDDTHYSAAVDIPRGTAEGDYRLSRVDVQLDSVNHIYDSQHLPSLSPVAVHNPEHLNFSPIKKLETKP